jgi:hypothetical protein
MSRLTWEARDYEIGVDRGVYYPKNGVPEVWNGLVSVTENTPDISERVRYVEGRKIANLRREDSFSATISAFSHPTSFLLNPRIPFGMSYRVETAKGYKIHLVYNALAHISSRNYGQADSPDPVSFNIATVPVAMLDLMPSAHLIIDTAAAYPGAVTQFEDVLYGNTDFDPQLPLPSEVFDIFELNALFKIIDNGDGTFTMEAPDDVFLWFSATQVEVEWPRILTLDEDTYRIRSW